MTHQNIAFEATAANKSATEIATTKPQPTVWSARNLATNESKAGSSSRLSNTTHDSLENCKPETFSQDIAVRLNDRQEKFCRYFIASMNASRAAREAGYSAQTARQQGHRLLQDDRIRNRLHALQKSLGTDHGTDPVVLIGKLETVYRRAMEMHHFHAATRAIEVQARISGVLRNRVMASDNDLPIGLTGEPLPHGSDAPPAPLPGKGRCAKKRRAAMNDA